MQRLLSFEAIPADQSGSAAPEWLGEKVGKRVLFTPSQRKSPAHSLVFGLCAGASIWVLGSSPLFQALCLHRML